MPRGVERVLDVLETVVADVDGITLTEVAERNELTPTTALRYLRALQARRYVHRDADGSYRPGVSLHDIAARIRDRDPVETLIAEHRSALERIARATGETTYLAVAEGRSARYVASAESTHAVRHTGGVGQVLSRRGTAVGEALADPGRPAVSRDAVEAGITAVSLALSAHAAVSVVGPTHRMDDTVVDHIIAQLQTEVHP